MLDGAGVGALPDAYLYGDKGSNTLGHIISTYREIKLPNLASLGLGKIVESLDADLKVNGAYGKMSQLSKGKDTISGHWEIAGVPLNFTFPVYPDGFPVEVVRPFEQMVGKKVLGNITASGTEIIKELGVEHLETGRPIVYTSADSVFQVAAHESIVSLETLYEWCRRAREEILQGDHAVGRVIARPFRGTKGDFWRTENRKDFSLLPPELTLLDYISQAGMEVCAVGKVKDIFSGRGITRHIEASGNHEIMKSLLSWMKEPVSGLIWATFVDFDMLYGHRNDLTGFARALEEFDQFLGEFLDCLTPEDLLIITADHGCDPTFKGTDHTREYVPLLVYGQGIKPERLGTRNSFADVGVTVLDVLNCPITLKGESFAKMLV